ncbi:energy-coupling factor transporter ATPase [Collinsella sp. CLA-ER-H10]|uniref:ABC transporter ATP-binding protein n=1 Tax=Collinsella sp. CLA-ER-H10 TaxID=3136218 RepID=UPI0032C16883
METIINVDDVSFSYGTQTEQALSHISLSVNKGDFIGIIGPSGAGKSTLAACLSGAVPHHYTGTFFGSVMVDGHDTCEVSLTDVSQIVGSVLQDIDTQMVASVVEDEMLFGLENFAVPHDQIEQRVSETLETVGISDLRAREIATLSGGQKQKVAIAAILAMRPRVLVLDEPTAALDPASSTLVFETLREANRALGITIVVVEQKVALLSEYCNRVLVLNHGEIALQGEPHEVFAHTDELRAIGVDCPRVTRIFNSLQTDGLVSGTPCLDVDEAERLISDIVDPVHAVIEAQAPAGSPHAPSLRPHAKDAEPVLTFDHVEFAYPNGGAAVHDLNLTLYPGELVGIVGQNGAGKTTLTKLLTGLLKPASGSVRVTGLDTAAVPTSRIAREVATLFQNPDRQICKDTVLNEVAFGLELAGIDRAEALRRAQLVIDRFGLPADEAPFSLSRGQRQMVALASVVVVEPKIVVLDEPTSGLDYRECMTVMETVRTMAERGCAVIMVCHDMEVVSDFAERIVVMADGRILDRGRTHELFSNIDLMRRAYVEPPQVIELSRRLASSVSPAFAQVSEVTDVVRITKEMIHRG